MPATKHFTSMGPTVPYAERLLGRKPATNMYQCRLAETEQEMRAAQALRFLVFNIEMNEGLEESYRTLLDQDPFDAYCDHLLVEHVPTGEIVGTYRMQTGHNAASNIGYYSELEFDLSTFDSVRNQVMECGRACVLKKHRNFRVLSLLWHNVLQYAKSHNCRYLLGCSSLTSQNPADGLAMYESMKVHFLAEPAFRVKPLPEMECKGSPAAQPPRTPKLLAAYFSLGCKVCGPPAIDREFGTIDFLTLLDMSELTQPILKSL